MPAAEITAGIISIRAAIDLTKAMVGVRDDKLIAAKTNELRLLLGDAIGKFVEAQKAQLAQLDEITALKAQIRKFSDWEAGKQRYELKNLGRGAFAYMNKPAVRGAEPPHWLCPTCFENGKKAHFQFSVSAHGLRSVYRCKGCDDPALRMDAGCQPRPSISQINLIGPLR
jgi:hypothetical protein